MKTLNHQRRSSSSSSSSSSAAAQDVFIWQLPVGRAVPVLHLPGRVQQPLVHAVRPQLLYGLHQQILGWMHGLPVSSVRRRGGGGGGGVETEKKRGGRRDGNIPDYLFDELKKKFPRALPKSPETLTCETRSLENDPTPQLLASSAPPPPQLCPSSSRRRFTMSGAASSQSIAVCGIHSRGITVYCRTDRVCICPDCEAEQHQGHDTVSVEDEWMGTKSQLSVSSLETQEMIRERIRKIEEIRASVRELELAVERETAGSVGLFSALVSAIERSQAQLMEVMEMSRRAAEHQADAMIRQLELEVQELRRRESALAALAQSDDPSHCVKTFHVLSTPPPTRNWSGVSKKVFPPQLWSPVPVRTQPRMRRVQEYALDVTLDGDTAHPRLIVTEDMKSVRCGDRHQLLPDHPERFDRVVCVLGNEVISSGRHYWEVEVGGKTDWDVGVATKSMNRKGKIDVTPENGYWFLSLRNKNKYAFRTEPSTDVCLTLRPQKIGVFVDFEKGQVSFYNVDAKIHIYTFSDPFTECIVPFFSPCTNKSGKNEAPLVLTPVNTTE
ncbi:unnamed protein product [Pleuronectes platessa]|uniref:Uncharacterized protein n=1 Tax=Pleuronectes platessa TaxID=8262 RepID=A0A9N7Y712_PLEPL|nr:unnamed protein product [Pleuronectes platessa]